MILKGRIFLLWISVSSYVRSIVPHIPPERSIGYWRMICSGILTNCSLIEPIVAQYLIFGFDQPGFEICDDGVMPTFPDEMSNLLGFCTMDKIFLQALDNIAHVLMERLFFAVIVDEVFEHVTGKLINAGIRVSALLTTFPAKISLNLVFIAWPLTR